MSEYQVAMNNLCTLYASKQNLAVTLAVYKGREFVLIPNQYCLQKFWYLFLQYAFKYIDHDIEALKERLIQEIRTQGFEMYVEAILNIDQTTKWAKDKIVTHQIEGRKEGWSLFGRFAH